MPQFTEFPPAAARQASKALTVLMDVLKAIPAEARPFASCASGSRAPSCGARERLPQLLRFFRLPG
ncbi:MAG: hypothetical protein R3F43_27280 [bacterium]